MDGYIWTVTAHLFGLPVYGYDRYTRGTGEMRHRLCGAVTVMAADGPDIARSAGARHTSEIIWAPAAALARQVGWRAIDDNTVALLVPCADASFGGRVMSFDGVSDPPSVYEFHKGPTRRPLRTRYERGRPVWVGGVA